MEITSVRIFRKEKEGSNLKAVASVILDDCFAIHGIKIIQGPEKLFLAMPSRKVADGEFKDIVHPLNSETRKVFEDKILAAYEEELTKPAEDTTPTEE